MNIAGLSKAAILAALYNASRPQGMGFLNYDPTPMTEVYAQELLDGGYVDFDYLKGRVMKINLSKDEVDTWSYNRDNGQNSRTLAIDKVAKTDEYGNFKIMRVFGKIKDVPSLKRKYIDLGVLCL